MDNKPTALDVFKAIRTITGYYASSSYREHTDELDDMERDFHDTVEAMQVRFSYRVFDECDIDPEDLDYLMVAEETIQYSKTAAPPDEGC